MAKERDEIIRIPRADQIEEELLNALENYRRGKCTNLILAYTIPRDGVEHKRVHDFWYGYSIPILGLISYLEGRVKNWIKEHGGFDELPEGE